MNKKTKRSSWTRYIVQIVFFLTILVISVNHTLAEQGGGFSFIPSASIHALCPFGGVVTIYKFLTTGGFIQKIHESAFVLMFIGFFIAVLFGAVFCGWLCPFGSVQEWVGKLGKKIFGKSYNNFIPYKYDKYLRFLRYGVLGWVVYMTAVTGKLVFSDVDPYSALFHLWTGEVATVGLIVLILTLLASLLVERPWCKYLCPYGAILGLTNSFRVFKIRRNPSSCVSCSACNKACPMNINVSQSETIKNHQCIGCMKCTSEDACPIADTVEFSVKGGKKIEA